MFNHKMNKDQGYFHPLTVWLCLGCIYIWCSRKSFRFWVYAIKLVIKLVIVNYNMVILFRIKYTSLRLLSTRRELSLYYVLL